MGITPPANDIAQVVKGYNVLAPQHIQALQNNLLLDIALHIRGIFLSACRITLVGGFGQSFEDFLIRDAFLFRPLIHWQVEVEVFNHVILQVTNFPRVRIGFCGNAAGNNLFNGAVAHVRDGCRHILGVHEFLALAKNSLALVIHHVVIFEDVLANVEVARLNLLLRGFQRFVDPRVSDRFAFLQAKLLEHGVHALRPENPHEIIIER